MLSYYITILTQPQSCLCVERSHTIKQYSNVKLIMTLPSLMQGVTKTHVIRVNISHKIKPKAKQNKLYSTLLKIWGGMEWKMKIKLISCIFISLYLNQPIYLYIYIPIYIYISTNIYIVIYIYHNNPSSKQKKRHVIVYFLKWTR